MNGDAHHPMRCAHCGDVIGTYEPVVVVNAGTVRQTSGAAEPEIRTVELPRFHRDCFDGELPDGDLDA